MRALRCFHASDRLRVRPHPPQKKAYCRMTPSEATKTLATLLSHTARDWGLWNPAELVVGIQYLKANNMSVFDPGNPKASTYDEALFTEALHYAHLVRLCVCRVCAVCVNVCLVFMPCVRARLPRGGRDY